jgi:putative phosphoribosyl transferase
LRLSIGAADPLAVAPARPARRKPHQHGRHEARGNAVQPNPPLWRDRTAAGRELAERWVDLSGRNDTLLIGLPRGGVAVGAAMADVLALPLASWAVRKITGPDWPEVAIGAVAPGGVVLWGAAKQPIGLSHRQLAQLVRQQQAELLRRQSRYGDPDPRSLAGLHLVVVDDGIATGLTAQAALLSLRRLGPASLGLAVPVADRRLVPELEGLVDRLEILAVVPHLQAVGPWYERFEQLDDSAVIQLLAKAGQLTGAGRRGGAEF